MGGGVSCYSYHDRDYAECMRDPEMNDAECRDEMNRKCILGSTGSPGKYYSHSNGYGTDTANKVCQEKFGAESVCMSYYDTTCGEPDLIIGKCINRIHSSGGLTLTTEYVQSMINGAVFLHGKRDNPHHDHKWLWIVLGSLAGVVLLSLLYYFVRGRK